jgi:hypothetical protein
MNGWLSVHGIGKRVPAVSGGKILLQSSWGGENKSKSYVKEEFLKKWEERRKRRVWKFQGDREEGRHQYVQRATGKIRFGESVL